jgi:two-component system, cell cycle sensor histidine kinase and response regulator CckA
MQPSASSDVPISLLIVEDDDAERHLLAHALALQFPRLTIHQACDGEHGLELFRAQLPDILLVDISMPLMDGISLSRRILASHPATQVIVISGNSDLVYLLEAIKLGIKQYLLKPLIYSTVFDTISDCLTRLALEGQVKRQDEQLRKLWRAVDQSPAMIAIVNQQGEIECLNRRYLEQTGFGEEEMLGRPLEALCGCDQQELASLWTDLTAGSAPSVDCDGKDSACEIECPLVCRDGGTLPCLLCAAPVLDAGGAFQGASLMFSDSRGRKKRLEETVRTQKLESLGVLAGGIAHDFNNVLTGVLGNINFVQSCLDAQDPLCAPLRDAEEASLRAAELARQLLTFARGGKPVKKQVALRQLLEDSAAVLAQSRVNASIQVAQEVDRVEADDGLLRQAFSNILSNAAESMPAGGVVQIDARQVELGTSNLMGLPAGSYLKLSFQDEGCGIPESSLRKVFDPYFSTKPGASGLGLASAYATVTSHGGHIGARSRLGRGTAITCHLPLVLVPVTSESPAAPIAPVAQAAHTAGPAGPTTPPAAPAAPTSPAAPASPPAASDARCGPVLIMDDENIVRKVASKMLDSLGYTVTTCADGAQAVRLYRQARESGTPFMAVLMDLTIPGGMGGTEAAQAILGFDPQARLVVSSGYFDDPVLADFQQYGFCAVMPKPYKLSELAQLMDSLGTGTGSRRAPVPGD